MTDNKGYVKPSTKGRLEMQVSPIFDQLIGRRTAIIRMKLLLDQKSLGLLLGISQQQVSQLERGRIPNPPFSLALFRTIFGPYTAYILYGSNPEAVPAGPIKTTYWNTKLKKRTTKALITQKGPT